jgi:mannosylfructose-phosphate synthase
MTAVEAMACGTPTVITTEGGLWESITWGVEALYANPFDPPAFGHMICNILQFPRVRNQVAKYGSHKARARFTWNSIAQQILGVVGSLPGKIRVSESPESPEVASPFTESQESPMPM